MNLGRAILTACIIEGEENLPTVISSGITHEHFDTQADQEIFEVITNLYTKTGTPPDQFAIEDALSWHEAWDSQYKAIIHEATNFIDAIVIDRWIPQFIKTVQKRYERQAYSLYRSMSDKISDEDLSGLHEKCQALLKKADDIEPPDNQRVDVAFDRIYERFDTIRKGEEPPINFTMNFLADFSRKLADIENTELVIVAGRPGTGKSSLVNNGILENILAKRPGILINLEMGEDEILLQLAAIHAGVNLKRIKYVPDDLQNLEKSVRFLEPLVKKYLTLITEITNVRKYTAKIQREFTKPNPPQYIVVDYIQLIEPTNPKENRAVQVGGITRALKKWTLQFRVPVIALSQLNRSMENENREPRNSDLRESGSIEQDANRILLLYKALTNSAGVLQEDEDIQEVVCIQSKLRNGSTGRITLAFVKRYTRFASMDAMAA